MKHLILAFDGTWNSAATGHYDDITNVFRLNLAISREDSQGNPQIIFYIPGPGTRGFADEQLGGAFGQGIDQIIREAYVNLASNYSEGDIIYLFGFSRGAIAARALTCLIAESGLLRPQRLHLLPIAWKRFVNINHGKELHPGLPDLIGHVHRDVRIKFIGLFDSVLGRSPNRRSKFSDLVFANSTLSPIIDHAVQLLSIDDSRKVFTPLLWDQYDHSKQTMEQIWFPGVHGDVGGIGAPHFLSVLSLLTMIARVAQKTDLRINKELLEDFTKRLIDSDEIIISNERSAAFWAMFSHINRQISKDSKCIWVHEILEVLFARKLKIRGSMEVYCGPHLEALKGLPYSKDCYSDLAKIAAAEALLKMH